MKKMVSFLKCSILFYVFLFSVLFFGLNTIIKLFNLEYRQWVFYAAASIIILGIIIGFAQLVRKIKRRTIKITCAALLVIGSFCAISYFSVVGLWSYCPEHIVSKGDYKLVAYVNAFLHTDVKYYDYINPFFHSKHIRLYEDYGSGGFDPLESTADTPRVVQKYTWYDDNGDPISD